MDIAETCGMKPFTEAHRNIHHEGGSAGRGGEGSDDEDDDGRGGKQGVRC